MSIPTNGSYDIVKRCDSQSRPLRFSASPERDAGSRESRRAFRTDALRSRAMRFCVRQGGAHRAFTLIELLVVIAILIILALIAIPNFLEAQTRGKIARAQVDLRTLAIALEAYRSDHGVYPHATTFCASMMDSIAAYNQTPEALVAPIAYVAAVPEDIFNPGQSYKYITPGMGWANGSATILAIWVPENFPNEAEDARDIPYFSQQSAPIAWGLWSVGPSGPLTVFDSDIRHIPVPRRTWYNPTNGTISDGIIPRLSDGHSAP